VNFAVLKRKNDSIIYNGMIFNQIVSPLRGIRQGKLSEIKAVSIVFWLI